MALERASFCSITSWSIEVSSSSHSFQKPSVVGSTSAACCDEPSDAAASCRSRIACSRKLGSLGEPDSSSSDAGSCARRCDSETGVRAARATPVMPCPTDCHSQLESDAINESNDGHVVRDDRASASSSDSCASASCSLLLSLSSLSSGAGASLADGQPSSCAAIAAESSNSGAGFDSHRRLEDEDDGEDSDDVVEEHAVDGDDGGGVVGAGGLAGSSGSTKRANEAAKLASLCTWCSAISDARGGDGDAEAVAAAATTGAACRLLGSQENIVVRGVAVLVRGAAETMAVEEA